MEKLNPDFVKDRLKEIKGWIVEGNSIKKIFKTKGWPETMGIISMIGTICHQHDHHPDYLLVKYSEIEAAFSTHTAGGITQKDIDIAIEINKFA